MPTAESVKNVDAHADTKTELLTKLVVHQGEMLSRQAEVIQAMTNMDCNKLQSLTGSLSDFARPRLEPEYEVVRPEAHPSWKAGPGRPRKDGRPNKSAVILAESMFSTNGDVSASNPDSGGGVGCTAQSIAIRRGRGRPPKLVASTY